ncbi:MAG: bacillithiol biosynthesis deacetylase BshB1 [Chitinophagaceae bacterium]|nr:bacillithiol biosynthesis deacetylase BshB1 [Chitinophagaceae bacterium]
MKLDILAIAAHPDDIELSCSGTLLLHKNIGYKTGILDLTKGELGSRGDIETRQKESERASAILKLDIRENAGFRDGFFVNDETHQKALIRFIRKYRPNIVLGTAPSDRHPDHSRASQLIKDACFYSGLVMIETMDEGVPQEAWRPKRLFNYIQDQYIEPDFVVDITEVMPLKMDAIRAYGSQFHSKDFEGPKTYISNENYLNTVEYRNIMFGKRIGTKYAEGFVSLHNQLGLKDFSSIILPDLV